MTKSKLIDEVAKAAGTTKADAESVLEAFFATVTADVVAGGKVAWPGFGSFSATRSEERMGRNPRTGETVKIAATTRMKFSASSTLKAALNPTK
ncbi:MAG: HU family DNA-binding protein [Actinobacteria bacterium]|uniref:Unannotated protein n=1 Tax=freshwater metagenome TaxID=449393 RepID=A0A6J6YJQ0_9ZZZZ|nr:HU family DNA-binding protein [Actinomycetota bacterium]MSY13727.1 HU family DNA-binding protein [Actinomycetota bacterium]MSZ02818.1 HU family DNA-binding protein [Actinomycetota bacterium]MTB05697.1 HU family DNA-binding protein [Actinomycetota bacterium]